MMEYMIMVTLKEYFKAIIFFMTLLVQVAFIIVIVT